MKLVRLALFLTLLMGCSQAPNTFIRSSSNSWRIVSIRDEIDIETAWSVVLELLIDRFVAIDNIDHEIRYLQTSWLYTWLGDYEHGYRVRLTIILNEELHQIRYYPEAQFLSGKNWQVGIDIRFVANVESDIMGLLTSVTR